MVARARVEPMIASDILVRVLAKLDIASGPTLDLFGLNRLYAAYSSRVPNDNVQKRIWLTGDRATPVTGGDPNRFFDDWLDHGTGGTCFAANGALCALLRAIGFDARRISGSVLMEGIEQDGNHGSVTVRLDGTEYLVDAQLAAFKALPLVPGVFASTGEGIHDIRAVPVPQGFDVYWYPGANRHKPLIMRPNLEMGTVDHEYFLAQYALSTLAHRRRSPFNDALFVGRHFPGSILIVSRNSRIEVSSENIVSKSEITLAERARILIDVLGISERAVNAIPPDQEPGG
jgi:arylamine N-acetyltransferase